MRIVIPGKPQGKARPRFSAAGGKVRTYTPQKTKDYEELIAWEYKRQGGLKYSGEIELTIYADFTADPKRKPDADNIAKVVMDALNGVAYADDAQVTLLTVKKKQSKEERLIITVDGDKIIR